jgi:hypothetical protein
MSRPLFTALVLLALILLGLNLVAYYVVHPPPVVTTGVLVVLGAALVALRRMRG